MYRRSLEDCHFFEVELGRKRVAKGVEFFNLHFPGWQQRIMRCPQMLYMSSFDCCAAALAAKGRVGPEGYPIYTHGDVCRAYPSFNSKEMGCMPDNLVFRDVLELCWLEAAQIPAPAQAKIGWLDSIYHWLRLWNARKIYGPNVELAY